MTFRTVFLRALAATAAGLICQAVHADDAPLLALVSVEAGPVEASTETFNDGGVPERKAAQAVDPPLSLLPQSQLVFPDELVLGENEIRWTVARYTPLYLETMTEEFQKKEEFITSKPTIFDSVGDYFDGINVEWPLGTQQSVFIVPTPVRGHDKLIPFVDLLQDGDERTLDAHLRFGAGVGIEYLIDKDMSIDAEVMALDSAGDHNPANSSETRFMLIFTRRF